MNNTQIVIMIGTAVLIPPIMAFITIANRIAYHGMSKRGASEAAWRVALLTAVWFSGWIVGRLWN